MNFHPHQFKPEVSFHRSTPRVLVSRLAYAKMVAYVDIASKEVGWLGRSVRLPGGDFLVDDVYLFRQEVGMSTCEISPDSLAEFAHEMLSKYENGVDVVSDLRFWGHSHVNGGTSPSGQDNSQMNVFLESGCDWFIRGIFNKSGRAEFTIFLYDQGIVISDAEWDIYDPEDATLRSMIESEFAEKITEKSYVPYGCYGGYRGGVGMREDVDEMGLPNWAKEDEQDSIIRQIPTNEIMIQQEEDLLDRSNRIHDLPESSIKPTKRDIQHSQRRNRLRR